MFTAQVTIWIHSICRSPNIMFLESLEKFGNMESILLHYKPFAGCLKWPFVVCSSACHLMSFASFALLNKRFNHGTTRTTKFSPKDPYYQIQTHYVSVCIVIPHIVDIVKFRNKF